MSRGKVEPGRRVSSNRVELAVEAAAKALHDTVRRQHQLRWELMSETWRNDMRDYVRPCVLATLKVADSLGPQSARPTVPSRGSLRGQEGRI
jgi:hypothetical protein